jgi:hypothetical protein
MIMKFSSMERRIIYIFIHGEEGDIFSSIYRKVMKKFHPLTSGLCGYFRTL